MEARRRQWLGGAAGLLLVFGLDAQGYGRRFWYPALVRARGPRTVEQVVARLRPTRQAALEAKLRAAGLAYPPPRLTLIAYKAERVLEVWAGTASGWALAQSYDVRAASGDPGPKLREGDLQVPEGEYRLTALNPNSSYHLSIRVDYPSDQDRAWARRDGRTRLGGDIFVHGKAVSIGCLAIGDDAIEELFLLVADTGLQRSRILIAPNRAFADLSAAHPWFEELYRGLRARVEEVRGAAVK